jgi:hypothetical protein
MRVLLPCGAEANVSEHVSPETLAALDEMMTLVSKYYVEKFAKEVLQEIDTANAE